MIPQEKSHACMHVSTFKCDEELINSSETELTAKWCIVKPRTKEFKKTRQQTLYNQEL
jgi:hypothetical protein